MMEFPSDLRADWEYRNPKFSRVIKPFIFFAFCSEKNNKINDGRACQSWKREQWFSNAQATAAATTKPDGINYFSLMLFTSFIIRQTSGTKDIVENISSDVNFSLMSFRSALSGRLMSERMWKLWKILKNSGVSRRDERNSPRWVTGCC